MTRFKGQVPLTSMSATASIAPLAPLHGPVARRNVPTRSLAEIRSEVKALDEEIQSLLREDPA